MSPKADRGRRLPSAIISLAEGVAGRPADVIGAAAKVMRIGREPSRRRQNLYSGRLQRSGDVGKRVNESQRIVSRQLFFQLYPKERPA